MTINKYLIARDQVGQEHPVVFGRALTHNTMVPPGCTPVSAGFVIRDGTILAVPDIESESLHLGPRPQDKQLLTAFLS